MRRAARPAPARDPVLRGGQEPLDLAEVGVEGQFSIDEKLCDEPRVDPLLTVMYASNNAKGNVVQAISGPFDLGRPRGCPKSARGGKTRIPQSKDTSAER